MAVSEGHGMREATLYIVATPIGNLGDMSDRARTILSEVDLVAAEDTRHSGRLMQHCGITTPMMAYHDHSQQAREDALLEALEQGRQVALISDAGTPLISDPGYSLVRRARQRGFAVRPVPGASAVTAALSVAGLPSDRFAFEGFPAARRPARRAQFERLRTEVRTLVFYESPHRIRDCLADMEAVFGGDREAVVCRELTKLWETVKDDTLAGLNRWLLADDNNSRGEFVVLVRGAPESDADEAEAEADRVLAILLEDLPVRQAAALTARITGGRKNELYRRALEAVKKA